MPTPSAPPADAARPPLWHTLALVCFLLLVAAVGTWSSLDRAPPTTAGSRIVAGYLPLLVVNALLALYVARLGRGQSALSELVGRRWHTAQRGLADATLALVAGGLIVLTEVAWSAAFGAPDRAWANTLLPRAPLERASWAVVALTVGTCEELVYRGYLQRELGLLARSRVVGLLAQAALFAMAHGQQGGGAVLRSFFYGLGFGALAHARKSLLPGMLAHVGIDLAAGLLPH